MRVSSPFSHKLKIKEDDIKRGAHLRSLCADWKLFFGHRHKFIPPIDFSILAWQVKATNRTPSIRQSAQLIPKYYRMRRCDSNTSSRKTAIFYEAWKTGIIFFTCDQTSTITRNFFSKILKLWKILYKCSRRSMWQQMMNADFFGLGCSKFSLDW